MGQQSWYQLDWLWTTTAWLLAIAGTALLLYSLFRDRSRGRRRCPKCWYDMTGVPGHTENTRETYTCPECGRHSPLRRLHRTRRKWFRAAAALLILICACAAAKWREYAAGGWVRLVPSTALVFWAPTEFQPNSGPPVTMPGSPSFNAVRAAPTPPPSNMPSNQRIGLEAWRRINDHLLWKWQSQMFVSRALREAGIDITKGLFVASHWPKGEEVRILFEPASRPFGLSLHLDLDHASRWNK